MKSKKYLLLFLCIIISSAAIFLLHKKNSNSLDAPFAIKVSSPKITYESEQLYDENDVIQTLDGTQKRLNIVVSIDNILDAEYKNVWFELKLNEEVRPYIASQIIEFTSDKMDITTIDKAKTINSDSNKIPPVSGFEHEWEMLLSSDDILKEYHDLSETGIYTALKNITVHVYWDGGHQETTLPLLLKK